MFPKGPRFPATKPSDIPGPNAYTIPQESALDSYKRGAFLEKTDRFTKDKQPTAEPAKLPSTAPDNAKPKAQPDSERYRILQKKVEDLEKVHLEGKKAHQVELDRLKQDLAASQKASAENAERLEKQKKQNAVLEARVQELKKTATSDQSELKDLRHKLRVFELERDKASSKHSEILELKKSLAALESKRKDDLKERDRHVAELEKQLQAEKRKRESSESAAQESRRALEEELTSRKTAESEMEKRLKQALEESHKAKSALHDIENSASDREDALVQQLEQHRLLLNTVAEQYGALASQTVSLSKYTSLQREHHALQLRELRLERKLANAEGQVVELAHLIRQVKDQKLHLDEHLSTALEEISFLTHMDHSALPPLEGDNSSMLDDVRADLHEDRMKLIESTRITDSLVSTYYQLKSGDLHFAASVFLQQYAEAQALVDQRSSDLTSALASHEAIATRLESIQKEKAEFEEKMKDATATSDDLRASLAVLETQLAEAQDRIDRSESQHAVALKKEKDTVARLTSTVQKTRIAEDALRAEIEQLSAELTEAERFQQAYHSLSDEVGSLITRNQLAEEEAARISKFNAEILGHNNPAQRIMYVDRIRRELAEAKHKIAQLTREQEIVLAHNEDLQTEIGMYKSVRVPQENKPRTAITRIGRPPLVNLGNSLNIDTRAHHVASLVISKPSYEPLLEYREGDMTMDELMYEHI